MFARDFVEIPQPFELVAPPLLRDPEWLNPIVHDALVVAIETLGALRPRQALMLGVSAIDVRCARGMTRLRRDSLVMPLRWETNLPQSVVPSLDGDLEILPLGVDRCQLALNATYASAADGDVIRRVIETGLRAFLRQLGARLGAV